MRDYACAPSGSCTPAKPAALHFVPVALTPSLRSVVLETVGRVGDAGQGRRVAGESLAVALSGMPASLCIGVDVADPSEGRSAGRAMSGPMSSAMCG